MALTHLKLEFLKSLGEFWTDIFEGSDEVDVVATANSAHIQPFEDFSDKSASYVSVDDIPPFVKEDLVLFVFTDRVFVDDSGTERRESTSTKITYGGGRAYDDGSYYGEYEGTGANEYALDVDRIPHYMGHTYDGADVLVKDVDYTIVDGVINFEAPLDTVTDPVQVLADDDGGTIYVYHLWGFSCDYDVQAVQKMFGALTRIYGPSSEDYKSVVTLAWNLQVVGANATNVDRVCAFLAGVDHYDGPGNEMVSASFEEAGRNWIETASGVYGAPTSVGVTVGVGDLLAKGDRLFDAYDIYSGQTLPSADRVSGLVLSKGFLGPDYSDTLFIENDWVETLRVNTTGWYYVQTAGGTYYNVKDSDGHIVRTVSTVEEAQLYVAGIPDKIWVYGSDSYYLVPETYQFMLWLNSTGFFDDLAEKYGRVPGRINPMAELRDYLFGPNMTIIAVDVDSTRASYVSQLISVLSRTWAAGSTFVFYAIPTDHVETMSMSQVSEDYELFYALDAADTQDGGSDVTRAGVTRTIPSGGSEPSIPPPSIPPITTLPYVPPPINTVAPSVSGTGEVGEILSTTNGTWDNDPTSFTYQWQRDTVDILDATSNTYTLVIGDADKDVRCVVTAVNAAGPTSATSNAIPVLMPTPVNTVLPSVTGTGEVGQTLTTDDGTWLNSPDSYSYQWQWYDILFPVSIPGATSNAYTLVMADAGKDVRCVVTATNAGGSTIAYSNTIAVAALWTAAETTTAAWYDGADATTITEDVGISQWDDKGSSGLLDAIQETGTWQPAYNSALKRVELDGVDDFFSIASPLVAGDYHFFCVSYQDPTQANYRHYTNSVGATYLPVASQGVTNSNAMRLDGVNDPTGLELYLNGNGTPVTHDRGAYWTAMSNALHLVRYGKIAIADTSDVNKIGGISTGLFAFKGYFHEIVWVSDAVFLTDGDKIEGSLAWKWDMINENTALVDALPVGHPYKSAPPYVGS